MASELEQPEYPDNAEKLKHVGILDVGDQVLEDEVCVETYRGHEVYHIHG